MLIVERKQAPRNRHVGTQYTQRTLDSKEYNTRADTLSKFSRLWRLGNTIMGNKISRGVMVYVHNR